MKFNYLPRNDEEEDNYLRTIMSKQEIEKGKELIACRVMGWIDGATYQVKEGDKFASDLPSQYFWITVSEDNIVSYEMHKQLWLDTSFYNHIRWVERILKTSGYEKEYTRILTTVVSRGKGYIPTFNLLHASSQERFIAVVSLLASYGITK